MFNSVIFSVHLQYLYLWGTTAGKCCYGTGIWNPSCSHSPTPYWWSWRRCLHWEGPPLPAWCSTRPPPPAAAWTRALVDQIRVGRAWTPSELKSAGDSHDWGPGDVRTQLSASQHCTDQSAEAQHWLWPSPAPSLRHFSALIRSQVLSPTNVVILSSPLLLSAKSSSISLLPLTSPICLLECKFALKTTTYKK